MAFAGGAPLTHEQMLRAPLRWPRPSRLREPLKLEGKLAKGVAALEISTVGELLEHLPRDHRDARTIAALRAGEQATVAVEVRSIAGRAVRRRGMRGIVEASVFDETGSMVATFFNQPWLAKRYGKGTRLVLHGKADARGCFRVSHHAVGSDLGSEEAAQAVAHYPAAEGASSTQLLTLVRSARDRLTDVFEPLAAAVRVAESLPDRASALAAVHFAERPHEREAARARLAFEELLLAQLALLARRRRHGDRSRAPALDQAPSLSARWLAHALPFTLTNDQRAAIETIDEDLGRSRPMQRLLMGEVGSGKTVVALHAMLRAVEHGAQAALMAPTETLAEQHFATVQRLLGDEPVRIALLTGSTPAGRRRELLGRLESGELSMIVGTHALIEPDVRFAELALAVIDEQHRFGVRQREALDAKGSPHMLHMTATPIPRTLALARYGDLDCSVLRELPRGRQEVQTLIVSGEDARQDAYMRLREQLQMGRQGYVVCPLVEAVSDDGPAQSSDGRAQLGGESPAAPGGSAESDASEARAAIVEFERLGREELAGYRLALLHGQMRPREKQRAMAAFASGEAQVLVATTVIEVGVDVPNATIMLVENAERFGISQLHQLRGRVGRGEHRSSCLLIGPHGSARCRALVAHSDGFRLAEIDLWLRKEGDLIGSRQSGIGRFQVASLPEDAALLERARAWAHEILERDPQLSGPAHALLGDALERAYGERLARPIPA